MAVGGFVPRRLGVRMFKGFKIAAAVLCVSVAVAACGPNGPNKADVGLGTGAVLGGVVGNQFGKGDGKILATVAGALIGGVVGHDIGKQLDDRDRVYAQQAERDAFERGESGRPVQWRNPDNGRYGEVIPEASYRRGAQDCRNYIHKVYIDGRPQSMRGTACRNRDGTWTAVG
jgi:surface antigen